MSGSFKIKSTIGVVVVIALGIILFFTYQNKKPAPIPTVIETPSKVVGPIHVVIGKSVEGRSIDAYTYGTGKTHLEFIGGVHGGYEWNSVIVAYNLLDYLDENPSAVPENLTVTVIPDANPDGVYKVIKKEGRFTPSDVPTGISTVPGRFNANNVDLNRNFDCQWKSKSTWQNKPVSGGASAFSEPESMAIRDFILKGKPTMVLFWHSQSGAVYASRCGGKTLPETITVMNVFAKASKYKAVETFDAYQTSGDSEGWLASIGIPAITVELTTHETIEGDKNLAGVLGLFEYYKDF